MRDYVLIGLLLIGLPVAVARPYVGTCIFALLALMNPHRLTWGLAESFSWSFYYGIASVAGLCLNPGPLLLDGLRRYTPVLVYTGWMLVTTIFALQPEEAWGRFNGIWKVQLMCLVTLWMLSTQRRVEVFALLIIGSVAFYGFKGGLFTLLNGGNYRVYGPSGSVISDNNQLAAALTVVLPLLYWVYRYIGNRWLKRATAAVAGFTLMAIFGSHSRGAFLSILAIATFIILKSDRKAVFLALVPAAVAAAALFMPDQYWSRMETIGEYEEDSSALGRINAWNTAFNIANNRITGAGLEYYSHEVFAIYAPNPLDVHSSHSIYFQALGEHGWIGLGLFAYIFGSTWRRCSRIARARARDDPEAADPGQLYLLARMAQVSLVGFGIGGAFVNIGNWDFMYYLVALVMAIERLRQTSSNAPVSATVGAPSTRSGEHIGIRRSIATRDR